VIQVVVDDLALVQSDAIVRPATARLHPTTPAARRLEQLGGTEFARRLLVLNDLAVGAAVVTAAGGDLPAEFVIHAIVQSEAEPVTKRSVEVAWRSALQRAREWEFARLSAPPLGIGAGNLPLEEAADIMIGVLAAHLGSAPLPADVCFVVETPEEREVFEGVLRRTGVGRT
jgi:O-acetyl-ADP-ribose deacetylase (regulator of RNase III)